MSSKIFVLINIIFTSLLHSTAAYPEGKVRLSADPTTRDPGPVLIVLDDGMKPVGPDPVAQDQGHNGSGRSPYPDPHPNHGPTLHAPQPEPQMDPLQPISHLPQSHQPNISHPTNHDPIPSSYSPPIIPEPIPHPPDPFIPLVPQTHAAPGLGAGVFFASIRMAENARAEGYKVQLQRFDALRNVSNEVTQLLQMNPPNIQKAREIDDRLGKDSSDSCKEVGAELTEIQNFRREIRKGLLFDPGVLLGETEKNFNNIHSSYKKQIVKLRGWIWERVKAIEQEQEAAAIVSAENFKIAEIRFNALPYAAVHPDTGKRMRFAEFKTLCQGNSRTALLTLDHLEAKATELKKVEAAKKQAEIDTANREAATKQARLDAGKRENARKNGSRRVRLQKVNSRSSALAGNRSINDTSVNSGVDKKAAQAICFPGETLITLQDPSSGELQAVPIQDVHEGDVVLSCKLTAEGTCIFEPGRVQSVMSRTVSQLLKLTIGGNEVRVTEEHPFYQFDRKEWIKAQDIGVGDRLLTLLNEPAKVKNIEYQSGETDQFKVYNLRVALNHNALR